MARPNSRSAHMTENYKVNEGYLLALLPVLGMAVIAVHQMGKYIYFGVPLEFLEIDTVKILLSGLSLALYSAAALYALFLLYHRDSIPGGPRRFLHHLFIATFISMPFWVKGVGLDSTISWPTVLFICFCAAVTASAEHRLKRLKDQGEKMSRLQKIESYVGTSFWVALLILSAVFAHGSITAKDQISRTFISGSDRFVVARSGDVLISKQYDPTTKSFVRDRTILVTMGDEIELVVRAAPIAERR